MIHIWSDHFDTVKAKCLPPLVAEEGLPRKGRVVMDDEYEYDFRMSFILKNAFASFVGLIVDFNTLLNFSPNNTSFVFASLSSSFD